VDSRQVSKLTQALVLEQEIVSGGVIHFNAASPGYLTISDSEFKHNFAGANGGALFLHGYVTAYITKYGSTEQRLVVTR
jgi:hypothetical protein